MQFPTGMDEDIILTIAKDILKGLDYLHRHDLAHRDLKVIMFPPALAHMHHKRASGHSGVCQAVRNMQCFVPAG